MGYAMFAARKIMLTDSINTTQLELTNITNQLMDLADLGGAVSDGEISAFDIAECQNAGLTCSYGWDMAMTNVSKYGDLEYYMGLIDAKKTAREQIGISRIGILLGRIFGTEKAKAYDEYINEYKEQYESTQKDKIARELQKQIAKMENELEKRKNNLDTKLQAYNAELESVKQAESQGIKNATPNYAGG